MRKWRLFIMICIAAMLSLSAGCAVHMGDEAAQDETVIQAPTDSSDSPFSVPTDDSSVTDDSGDDSTTVDADSTDDTTPTAESAVEMITKDGDIDKEVSEGQEYSQIFEADGGSGEYAWTLEGALPTGLTLEPVGDRESITGTVALDAAGDYPLTLTVKDAFDSSKSDSISFTLTVLNTDIVIPLEPVTLSPILSISGLTMRLIKLGAPDTEGVDAGVLADVAAGESMTVGLSCEINEELIFSVGGVDGSVPISWEIVDSVSYPQSFNDVMEKINASENTYLTENNSWSDTNEHTPWGVSWDSEKSELHAVGTFCGYTFYGTYMWDYLAELLEDDPDANIYGVDYDGSINPTETLTITVKNGEDVAGATIKFLVRATNAMDDAVQGIAETQQNDQIPVSSDDYPGNAPNI